VFKHLLRTAGASALAVLVCAWLAGRLLSDRYAWSQPVSWAPPVLLAAPVWLATAAGVLRQRRGRAHARASRPPTGRRRGRSPAVRLGLVFTALSLAHLLFVELGLHRMVRARPAGTAMRLVFWNQAGHRVEDPGAIVRHREPTLLLLANRHSETARDEMVQAYLDTGAGDAARGWPFDLIGRLPIRRWATTSLQLEGRSRYYDGAMRPDPGWAAWFEVESDAGPLIIWAIDLPSDPDLARFPLARQAGEAVAAWTGATRTIEGDQMRFLRAADPGFPAPDIIVGDFNIPRGSASLREFLRAAGAPGMRDAFDLAGVGWQRTWPRRTPVWAIDQCFVSERVGVGSLRTFDPGVGGHRALEVVIEPIPAAR
jgi:hypothetical protein